MSRGTTFQQTLIGHFNLWVSDIQAMLLNNSESY